MRLRDDGCNAIQSRLRVIGAEVSASRSTEPASCGYRECHPDSGTGLRGTSPNDETGPWPCRYLYLAFVRVLQLFRLVRHDNEELAVEVVMLRHESAVLRRQVARPALRPTDRALFAGLSRLLDRRRPGRFFVRPDTLLRWHGDLVRRRWSEPHRPGRQTIPAGTVAIILRLARENPTWGYRRIQASPKLAYDIFTVDAVLLRRLYVLYFIDFGTRRVYLTGVAANPIGARVGQQARNLSMVLATRSHPVRLLVRYRDTEFTQQSDEFFRAEGVRAIGTPVRAPRANALAERFVGTVRREGLDRMLIFGRRHLERVLADHVAYYDEHRPHRALDQQPPLGVDEPLLIGDPEPSQLRRRDMVFGLIHEYQLAA